ncbi:MAG TPA: thioredoxin fold domain-containing protein [Parafilimonas sp.]|nr:thioredoxin fold domain-containing protein [Parafilimonas sp.]
MIKTIIVIPVLFISLFAFAQANNSSIAPFKIRLTNGQGYTYQMLPKNKPVILIYFSPTCEHCKLFTETMLKQIDKLKDDEVVMLSYEDIREVKSFDDIYKLSKHQNIKVGSEGYTFIVQKYYNIQRFPFVAEYDKYGKLKKIIRGDLKPEDIAKKL